MGMLKIAHARFCADPGHGDEKCCEAREIPIGDFGRVHILAGDTGPIAYVEDEERGLYAEFGKYDIDELEAAGLAYLEAVRVARADRSSARADALCTNGVAQ